MSARNKKKLNLIGKLGIATVLFGFVCFAAPTLALIA